FIPNKHYIITNYYEFNYLEQEFIKYLLINKYDVDFICSEKVFNEFKDIISDYNIENIGEKNISKSYDYYATDDITNELIFVENEIFKNIKDGYKLNDIAIISSDINEYKDYFNIIFKDLVYNYQASNGYLTKRIIETLKNILESNLSCDSFVNLLKILNYNKEDISLIDKYVFVWDTSDKSFCDKFAENPNGKKMPLNYYDKLKLEKINKVREDNLNPFKYLLENTQNESVEEIVKYLYTYLDEEKIFEYLSINDEKGLDRLLNIFDYISKYFNNISFYEILNIINELFEVKEEKVSYFNEIEILDINNINYLDKKIIYFVGFSEESISLKYKDMNLLESYDISKYSDIRLNKYLDKQNMLVHNILNTDSKIYITFHKQSDDSKILEEAKILNKLNINKLNNDKIYSNYSLINSYSKTNSKILEKYIDKDISEKINNASNYSLINKKINKQLYTDILKLSPSAIEMYSKCNFSYFCSYGLNLWKLEKKDFDKREVGTFAHFLLEKIFRNDINEINKDNIDKYIKKYSQNYLEDNFGIKSSTLDYLLSDICNNIKVIIQNILDELKLTKLKPKYFELDIKEEGSINPLKINIKKGTLITGGIVDRVDIYETDNKIYYRIVDYKTGSKAFRLDDTLEGLNLQMLIYLLAIKENKSFSNKELVPVGIEYYPVSLKSVPVKRNMKEEEINKELKKSLVMNGYISREEEIINLFNEDSLSSYTDSYSRGNPNIEKTYCNNHINLLFNKIKDMLENIGNDIVDGKIDINPIRSKRVVSCEYCNLKSICRFDDKLYRYRILKDYKNEEVITMLEGDKND
ncbi:MAG TPA: PD-(D/E)XK nuclease family protein, partial [Bacilli bacterium]|nr:PD-(D/E)XK nuclease family protein [Bacilli bacterium]